jgi:hypothetical protein
MSWFHSAHKYGKPAHLSLPIFPYQSLPDQLAFAVRMKTQVLAVHHF